MPNFGQKSFLRLVSFTTRPSSSTLRFCSLLGRINRFAGAFGARRRGGPDRSTQAGWWSRVAGLEGIQSLAVSLKNLVEERSYLRFNFKEDAAELEVV
jgi:hypothetical protein